MYEKCYRVSLLLFRMTLTKMHGKTDRTLFHFVLTSWFLCTDYVISCPNFAIVKVYFNGCIIIIFHYESVGLTNFHKPRPPSSYHFKSCQL